MDRIRLRGINQKEFFNLIIEKLNSPSLRGLIQFGIDVRYSALKNYYRGTRLIPRDLFEELIEISGLNGRDFEFDVLKENWGQVKGGKK